MKDLKQLITECIPAFYIIVCRDTKGQTLLWNGTWHFLTPELFDAANCGKYTYPDLFVAIAHFKKLRVCGIPSWTPFDVEEEDTPLPRPDMSTLEMHKIQAFPIHLIN